MSELWRGYVAHALLFYRQNNLKSLAGLPRLGATLNVGPCPELPPELERGLRLPERYWGSLRLGPRALAVFESGDSQWHRLLSGMTLEMQRRYVPAIERLESAMDGRWAWPYILRGVCRWYIARFKESVEDFSRAADLMPDPTLALLFKARAKADLRDRSLVKDLDRALRLSPDCGFTLSWRGRAMYVLHRTPEALKDLERSISLLPDYDRGYSWLGVSHAERGDFRRAVPLLEKARKLNPYYPTTLYPLARGLMKLGEAARAGKVLREAAAVDRSGVWVEHRISMSHPNPAALRSVADLDAYLAERPAGWARAWRGQTRLLLQKYWEALEDLKGSDPWSALWRGETLRRLGYARRALPDFRRAPRVAFALAGEGMCLLELGRARAAEAALTRALKLSDRCGPAWSWRGWARLRLGRPAEAAADLRRSLELQPHAVWTRELLWQAHALAGDRKAALEALQGVGEQSDRLWAARAWLSGDESARERALQLNPSQPLALRGAADAGEAIALCAPSAPVPQVGDPRADIEEASRALDDTLDPLSAPALMRRWAAKRALGEDGLEEELRLTALRGAASSAPASRRPRRRRDGPRPAGGRSKSGRPRG